MALLVPKLGYIWTHPILISKQREFRIKAFWEFVRCTNSQNVNFLVRDAHEKIGALAYPELTLRASFAIAAPLLKIAIALYSEQAIASKLDIGKSRRGGCRLIA